MSFLHYHDYRLTSGKIEKICEKFANCPSNMEGVNNPLINHGSDS